MKHLTTSLTLFFLLLSFSAFGQKKIDATNQIEVTGLVKKDITITLKDIEAQPSRTIPNMTVTNHQGETRSELKQIKGVLVKDLLKDVELKEDNLKLFSEFYFTFVASDGYKVVYSWNEIFNSPTGDNLYIVTSVDGEPLQDMHSRILAITPTDFKTGRRHIKCLGKIVVSRTE
ncbi:MULTISPECIES: molybdopterin-dependent oxidoreductase [Chitinophagaceae]